MVRLNALFTLRPVAFILTLEFEKYYNTQEGRTAVKAGLEKRYAIENALFLDATKNINQMDQTVLHNILRKFILRDSPLEVNLVIIFLIPSLAICEKNSSTTLKRWGSMVRPMPERPLKNAEFIW